MGFFSKKGGGKKPKPPKPKPPRGGRSQKEIGLLKKRKAW